MMALSVSACPVCGSPPFCDPKTGQYSKYCSNTCKNKGI
jgi:endogenous inhibitor of DNA gyrase (YacG/DUF329 family)